MKEMILKEVASLYNADDPGKLGEATKEWVESLISRDKEGNLSHDSHALIEVLSGPGDVEEKFLGILPERLGLGEVGNWNETDVNRYRWRLARAKMEAEVFKLKDFFPIPEEENERKEHFRKWIDELTRDYNYTPEEKETLLLDMLARKVWNW
ncbi:MAG: hypothetical protein J7M18_05015 [Candidatus Eremiobacteraeota bacterium]|nr:hypothetical protein [Candidatus Eremiobacteraeota bacterium]